MSPTRAAAHPAGGSPGAAPPARSRRSARLVGDAALLFGGELLGKVAGFAAFAYLARAVDPAGYGAVELAVALSMFFGLVVDFGFGPIGAREIAQEPLRARALATQIPAARLLLAVGAAAAMCATALAMRQPPQTTGLIALFAVALIATAWMSRWLFQGLDRMAWAALPQALRMLVFAVGVAALVRGTRDLWRVGVVEIGSVVAMAVYTLAGQRAIGLPVHLDFARAPLRALFREALPVGISQFFWALNQYLPTILVAVLLGSVEVAWFGGAHRIVMSVTTFVWLYHFNLFPSVVRTRGAGPETFGALMTRSFRVAAWGSVLGALAMTLFAEDLCRMAYGARFTSAAAAFAVIVWVLPVNLLSGHARYALIAWGRQSQEMAAQAVGAALTLVLGLALIPRHGALGAALAMLASALVVWAQAHLSARAHVGVIPFVAASLRPAAAAAAAAAAFAALRGVSPALGAAAAAGVYAAAAAILEPDLVRDLAHLRGDRRAAAASAVPPGLEP
jgi:O-antigen/teichoic acid export membrane protein